MGGNLLWTGATFILALPLVLGGSLPWALLGALLMIIGCILMWLGR